MDLFSLLNRILLVFKNYFSNENNKFYESQNASQYLLLCMDFDGHD